MKIEVTPTIKGLRYKPSEVSRQRITSIISTYFKLMQWDNSDEKFIQQIYKRFARPAKDLALLTKEGEDIELIHWASEYFGKKKLDWTIETVIRYLPEFRAKHQKSDKVKELEERLK